MKYEKKGKVEEQKGPINCAEPTYRFTNRSMQLAEQHMRNMELRRYQTMEMHEPKQ